MKIIIFICSLFICSYSYGFGYLETISALAIKAKTDSAQASHLKKTRNSAECNIRYQQEQQQYKDCTFREALSPPAAGVSECVEPEVSDCN